MMDPLVTASIIILLIASSIIATKAWTARRERRLIKERITEIFQSDQSSSIPLPEKQSHGLQNFPGYLRLEDFLATAGSAITPEEFILITVFLLALPPLLGLVFWEMSEICLVLGVILAMVPSLVLGALAKKRRDKFTSQLPDAIDLMVSILRSGHSIPQAIKSVSEDIPAPLGSEFEVVFHRMNLGQTLPAALYSTVKRFQSFELDLLRRATAIQLEVGGSLADLLEKTNTTLRQRLKLRRQIVVLTAQSRLTALIVSIMPFIVAAFFTTIKPDYLEPLLTTNLGKGLLALAISLQVAGFLIMRKLAAVKV